jgi:hypothetical protein
MAGDGPRRGRADFRPPLFLPYTRRYRSVADQTGRLVCRDRAVKPLPEFRRPGGPATRVITPNERGTGREASSGLRLDQRNARFRMAGDENTILWTMAVLFSLIGRFLRCPSQLRPCNTAAAGELRTA